MRLIKRTCNRRTMMKAKHLILTLSVALAASGAVAAIRHGLVDLSKTTPAAESTTVVIPRVVVTASPAKAEALGQSHEAPVARVVVRAPRHTDG